MRKKNKKKEDGRNSFYHAFYGDQITLFGGDNNNISRITTDEYSSKFLCEWFIRYIKTIVSTAFPFRYTIFISADDIDTRLSIRGVDDKLAEKIYGELQAYNPRYFGSLYIQGNSGDVQGSIHFTTDTLRAYGEKINKTIDIDQDTRKRLPAWFITYLEYKTALEKEINIKLRCHGGTVRIYINGKDTGLTDAIMRDFIDLEPVFLTTETTDGALTSSAITMYTMSLWCVLDEEKYIEKAKNRKNDKNEHMQ